MVTKRFCASLILLATLLCLAQPAAAQSEKGELLTQKEAQRNGLVRSWFTQVQLARARGRVVAVRYHINSKKSVTIHEVKYGNLVRRFSSQDRDKEGNKLELAGAKKEADRFVARLKDRKIIGKMTTKVVPDTILVATTDRAVCHAIDAHTGRTKWYVQCGRQKLVTVAPAINDDYVAVLNGSRLFLLTIDEGKIAWQRQVKGVPGAGPTLSETKAWVPTVSGTVEAYELSSHLEPPLIYSSPGRVITQPTTSVLSITWVTDRGFFYCGNSDRQGVRFRLEANKGIEAPSTYLAPNKFVVVSLDGYIYCMHELGANLEWRFPTGERISQPAATIGGRVYVVTDKRNMFVLNGKDGSEAFQVPRVRRFIAASRKRIYCVRGDSGRIAMLDIKTGGLIGHLNTEAMDLKFANVQSDRLFLGTKTGLIQCIHEAQETYPVIHVGLEEIRNARQKRKAEADKKKKKKAPAAKADDPLGLGM